MRYTCAWFVQRLCFDAQPRSVHVYNVNMPLEIITKHNAWGNSKKPTLNRTCTRAQSLRPKQVDHIIHSSTQRLHADAARPFRHVDMDIVGCERNHVVQVRECSTEAFDATQYAYVMNLSFGIFSGTGCNAYVFLHSNQQYTVQVRCAATSPSSAATSHPMKFCTFISGREVCTLLKLIICFLKILMKLPILMLVFQKLPNSCLKFVCSLLLP